MPVSQAQLEEFIAKYPTREPEATKPALGPDAGSYTTEKLAEWLEACSVPFEENRVGPGDNGRGFWIECPGNTEKGWPDGERHQDVSHSLTSGTACWVSNGHPRFECRHAHCGMGARGGKKTWKNLQAFYDPSGATQRLILSGTVTFGGVTPNSVTNPPDSGGFVNENIGVEESFPVGSTDPVYPLEVWEGTEYAEFAERGTRGNFIPPEFFIESLKTYVGAIAGNNMLISNERSGRPRFYTILLAGPGTGKNTAIDCTHDLFRVHNTGLIVGDWPKEALIWYPQHRIENSLYSRIGACRMKMSSASGLARSLPRLGKDGKICNSPQERLIVVYTELAEMFEKLGIEGSGAAMMSALCDLYDGEEFVVPALADNDSFGGRLMMSILAGIQPRKWDIVCAGKGIEGSGFDERINLIPTTNTKTVASLQDPDFSGFRDPFIDRLMALDKVPYIVKATTDAKVYANEEYQKIKPKEESDISVGRLQVLAWRNALHYAWLTRASVVDVDAVGRGMKLARYQHEVRKAYKPLTGDNHVARAANAIQRFLEKQPVGTDVRFRDLERAVHADRLGGTFDSALGLLATRGRIVQHEQKLDTSGGSKTTRFVRRLE